jgi:hypothetical protein
MPSFDLPAFQGTLRRPGDVDYDDHPIGPTVLGGMLFYPAAQARRLVRFWRDFMLRAPDDLGTALVFLTAPEENFVPAPVRGMPAIGVLACYSGEIDHGLQVLNPLLEFGPPAATLVQPVPYVAVQQLLDESNPTGKLNYRSADSLSDLPNEAVDTLVELATRPVSPFSQVILLPGGGARSRVAEEATAFGNRRAPWNIYYLSMWVDPIDTERNVAYTRKLSATMKPWSTRPASIRRRRHGHTVRTLPRC